jgi:hypothetical protein
MTPPYLSNYVKRIELRYLPKAVAFPRCSDEGRMKYPQEGLAMTKIDRFSLATVPVEQYADGKLLGSATAFVLKRGDKHYLVANWHVLTGKDATNGRR